MSAGNAGSSGAPSITEIELHPIVFKRVLPDEWVVVRADGRAAIRTRTDGVAAIRLLRRYRSLDRVREVLSTRIKEDVDLAPLIGALRRAGLVRALNRKPVDARVFSLWVRARVYWRVHADWTERSSRALFRTLPLDLGLTLCRPIMRQEVERSRSIAPAAELLRHVPGTPVEPANKLRERHVAAVSEQELLARALVNSTPGRLDRWLRRRVAVEGLEYLDQIRSQGRGVILAFLHHGPFPLIPVKLLSLGYPLHGFHWSVDFAGRDFNEVFASHTEQLGWGQGTFYGLPDLQKIAAFSRAIASGKTAMVMPDGFFASGAATGRNWTLRPAELPSRWKSSLVEVEIGDRRAAIHSWIGWLLRRTGAAVLPVRCRRDSRLGYRITIAPPVTWHDDDSEDATTAETRLTREVFASLAPDILTSPAEWTFLERYARREPRRGR